MIKIIELFAGIGACSKALKKIGIDIEIVDAVEIDKYAIASFNAIHNTNFNTQDVTEYNKDLKDIDIITHGSPCQDFSIAGKQAGGDIGSGTRSSLMYETIRIVEQVRPKYVLWENVKNILSTKHKHNFDSYIETMNALGYNSYYQVLNAKDYGIPQNRERVYTISIRKDIDKNKFTFPEKEELKLRLKDMLENEVNEKYYLSEIAMRKLKRHKNKIVLNNNPETSSTIHAGYYKMGGRDQQYIKIKNGTKKGYLEANEGDSVNLAYLTSNTRRGRVGHQVSQTLQCNDLMEVVQNVKIRKLTPKECWRLMGFSDKDFEKAASIPTSNTQLYKQAGNSIVVNVLEKIFKILLKEG